MRIIMFKNVMKKKLCRQKQDYAVNTRFNKNYP